jgi:hypothetical protein
VGVGGGCASLEILQNAELFKREDWKGEVSDLSEALCKGKPPPPHPTPTHSDLGSAAGLCTRGSLR